MMNQYMVSIVMPCYNGSKFIGNSIQSVLSQTYKYFELIVVDDGSSDNSMSIVKKFNDDRIKLLTTDGQCGAATARNLAIENARGRYIAFLDCDDLWHNDKLEKHINYIMRNDLAFSWTDYNVINENGEFIRIHKSKTQGNHIDLLTKKLTIGCLTVIYDVEKLDKLFMPNIKMRQDLALWVLIIKKCCSNGLGFGGCSNILSDYRVHSNSMTKNKWMAAKYQWRLYRNIESISIFKSTIFFISYIFNATKDRV